MSMILIMSAIGALALTSGIALAASQPHETGDHPVGDMTRAKAFEIVGYTNSAPRHEYARVAMREGSGRR